MSLIYTYAYYIFGKACAHRVNNPILKIFTMVMDWHVLLSDLEPFRPTLCHHFRPQGQPLVEQLFLCDVLTHVLDHLPQINPGDTLSYSFEQAGERTSKLTISLDMQGHYQCHRIKSTRPSASLVWTEPDTPYVCYYSDNQSTGAHAVEPLETRCLELLADMAADLTVYCLESRTDSSSYQEDPTLDFLNRLSRLQSNDSLRYRGYGMDGILHQSMVINQSGPGYTVRFEQHGPDPYIECIAFVHSNS